MFYRHSGAWCVRRPCICVRHCHALLAPAILAGNSGYDLHAGVQTICELDTALEFVYESRGQMHAMGMARMQRVCFALM